MADRRCFHKRVVESDTFYSLPESVQALYFHLNMSADEDGFINSANSVAGRIKGGKSALALLVNRGLILRFGEIYVVKDWRVSNTLKNDRTKAPAYPNIAAQIWVMANRSYTINPEPDCKTLLETKTGIQIGIHNGIQVESKMESQPKRTEQNRTELNRTEQNRMESGWFGVVGEERFERFWAAYPKHTCKAEAIAVWQSLPVGQDGFVDKVIAALGAWKASEPWRKEGGRYIPKAANWLSDDRNWTSPPKTGRQLDSEEIAAINKLMKEENNG